MKKNAILFLIFIGLSQFLYSQTKAIPADTISQYFRDIQSICERDNGKLWGKSLLSPVIVIDRASRYFVANENDSARTLQQIKDVYTGYFPENLIIANSTTDFGGKKWTMVAYPLPNNRLEREILFTHEMFHHLQPMIWKGNASYTIQHFENKQARILLKLEWNALTTAINATATESKKAIADALLFNYYRKQLYPGCDSAENRFEIMEGLAEYTAMKLCISTDKEAMKRINEKKAFYWNLDGYTRSFGYYSGVLYAYLLDFSKANWRTTVSTNSDLHKLLQNQHKIILPKGYAKEFETIKLKYGYDSISVFEDNREVKINKRIADYKEKLLVKPHLSINLRNMKIGFNPTNLISIDSLGTVYPNIRIIDDWGVLKVEKGGCLINNTWKVATINAENIATMDNTLTGDGWELKLNEKWKLVAKGANYELSTE
jgi:hypothetical protein